MGPQRVREPSLIASPLVGGGEGIGPHSASAGNLCAGDAADDEGSGGQDRETESEVGHEDYQSRPLHAPIAADPLWAVDGVRMRVWIVDTVGGGRCLFASALQALRPGQKLGDDRNTVRLLNSERRRALDYATASYTLERWVADVPWHLRTMEASPEHTSLATVLQRMREPKIYLTACTLYVLSDLYQVGIYLIVRSVSPADNEQDGGGRAAEYYHIRSPAVTSPNSIVLYSTVQHYETCEWLADDGVKRTRLCIAGSRMHTALQALCDDHQRRVQSEGFDQGEDTDQAAVGRPSQAITQPVRGPQPPLRRRSARTVAAVSSPAPSSTTAVSGRGKSQSAVGAKKTPARVGRRTQSATASAKPPSRPPLPFGSAVPLRPSDIANHGELYSCVSFTNVPQWVGMNAEVWNRYRMASQAGDRNAQRQAVEDVLLLPQRVLTRTSRGGGDGRRLTATVRARCRAVGEELRRIYPCPIARDDTVQLTVATVPLVHQASAAAADTESDCSTDDTTVAEGESSTEDEQVNTATSRSGEDANCDTRSFIRDSSPIADDPDSQAAKRAQHHVKQGHLRKAAQTLHSTTTMADLTVSEVQLAVAELHPPLSEGAVLPYLPADSPRVILEDDDVMRVLITQSNNGSASGPSGWGGNLLSTLSESALCRGGIIALLKDIINGDLPHSARQLLLSSRLVALNKPGGSGLRPIAMGEMFYRLAALIVTRNIAKTAASLLSPHQYGVGVSSGAERIVHSLQHTLADTTRRLSLLQVDISNAFNACDRGRMLRELYSTPELSPLYRMADFAYSTPSVLLLERAEGKSIMSRNGVRQGDPLSALLFCVYMREVLTKVSECADVQLYGFFDDLNVVGTPGEVLKAFDALRTDLLPAVSLTCNTDKSHFAYFHDDTAPLMHSQRQALADHDMQYYDSWAPVLGAVVGKDSAAVADGIACTTGDDGGGGAFFRRVQSDALRYDSALLLLRHCGVPQMSYLLRCTPPSCIVQQAKSFDERMLHAAAVRLNVHHDELTADAVHYVRAKLKHGGKGLTSAVCTSPAAYLGSLAAVATAAVFAPYTEADCPLESESALVGWIGESIQQLVESTPSLAAALPTTASTFFHHITSTRVYPRTSSSLQRHLSSQAALHSHEAFLGRCKEMKKVDGGAMLAHAKAVSAPRAWAWKNVIPTTAETHLSDAHYRIADRMSLGLPPINGMETLPDDCPLCHHKNAIRLDRLHFLTCDKTRSAEGRGRHDEIVNTLYRAALTMGIQAVREPAGLHSSDNRCPDLQLVLSGRNVISDVVVSHPLAPGKVKAGISCTTTGAAKCAERKKHAKYRETAAQHNAELLPFSVETYGGMAPDAIKLLAAMSSMGEEQMSMWPRHMAIRHLIGSVATSIQRGNAVTWLSGYSRAIAAMGQRRKEGGVREDEVVSEVVMGRNRGTGRRA